jgi:hypothetical protein
MFLQVQFPLFDGRQFALDNDVFAYPNWVSPNGGYVRRFGKIVSRPRQNVEGLAGEAYFCQMRNTLRADGDWSIRRVALAGAAGLKDYASRDNPRFVVRRLFFDGVFSGKVDLGFFLPAHLILDNASIFAEPKPQLSAFGLSALVSYLRTFLGRRLRLAGQSSTILGLTKMLPPAYAGATSKSGQASDLVAMQRPALYVEMMKTGPSGPEVEGWHITRGSFCEVYHREISVAGRDLPLFVTLIDPAQKANRGRHLRIGVLRALSEMANTQMLLRKMSRSEIEVGANPGTRPLVHAHLKRVVKFLKGASDKPYLAEAVAVGRGTLRQDSFDTAAEQLAQLDDYWEQEKRKALTEVIMGDKITADRGGVAIGRQAQVGDVQTASQSTEGTFDMAELAKALAVVAAEMERRAVTPVDKADSALVAEAAKAAEKGDENSAVAILKKVGSGFLDVAKDVGVKVAIAFATAKLGLG